LKSIERMTYLDRMTHKGQGRRIEEKEMRDEDAGSSEKSAERSGGRD